MKIKITTDHPSSSYGVPVILIDGTLCDYADGIAQIRASLGHNTKDLGEALGVSARTIEGWEQGRMPNTRALYALKALVEINK